MSDYPNARDCEHGHLRRACTICETNEELAVLRAEVETQRRVIAQNKAAYAAVSKSADLWHRRWAEEVRRVDALRAEARVPDVRGEQA